MATWNRTSGVKGYLLDVSTNRSFTTYLDGYRGLDIGDAAGRLVTGLNQGTTYFYRVRAYNAAGAGNYSAVKTATTVATVGLVIHPTFDSSITGNPNAAAIEAMINRVISFHESLFSDPITVQIRFRYSTTTPEGGHIPMGTLAQTDFVLYPIPWSTYIGALRADARSSNDGQANATLPGTALSTNIRPSSAGGRAVGLDTPPAMFADGTVGQGGPYDGIVTLNSAAPYQFSRPPNPGNFDAQRTTEHVGQSWLGSDQINLTKFGKGRVQLFPLLLRDRHFGGLRDTHPRIDFVLNPVVIRRTKKQLAHGILKSTLQRGIH